MNFDYLNKKYSEFNITIVKKLFLNIEKRIKENVALFHNYIEQDNKKFFEKFEYTKLLDVLDRVNKEEWIMEKSSKTHIYYGIGNIGVCYKGNIDIALYLILKALKTNNNIVFFEEDDIHQTTKKLLDIVNEECEKCNYNICFKIVKYNKILEFCNDLNNFNMFIFINELEKYLDFSARNQNDMKVICSNYGTMNLYLDDKNLKNTLLEIDNYVYDNNIELEVYKDKNVKEVVEQINIGKHNYCAVIFTKNKEDAYYFIKNVKAEKIFVNKKLSVEYEFELSDEDLTICKKIYI